MLDMKCTDSIGMCFETSIKRHMEVQFFSLVIRTMHTIYSIITPKLYAFSPYRNYLMGTASLHKKDKPFSHLKYLRFSTAMWHKIRYGNA